MADIMGDIGQLQIGRWGDTPLDTLLAKDNIPENATVLEEFGNGVKSEDMRSPGSSPCSSPPAIYFSFTDLANIGLQLSPKSSPISDLRRGVPDGGRCTDV